MNSGTDGETKPQEAEVQVWSNARIPQGVRVYPFQGTVRLDKLDVLGYLSPTDVSTRGAGGGEVVGDKRGISLFAIMLFIARYLKSPTSKNAMEVAPNL